MKKSVRKGILLLFGIIAGLILSEVVFLVCQIPRYYKAHSSSAQFLFRVSGSGELFYTNAKSSNIEFIYDGNPRGYFDDRSAVYHKTNSFGFRGDEFQRDKPAGTYRVAVMGDSFAFGEGVKDSDVYTSKLAGLMRNRIESEKGINCEVLNFGVGGYNTEQSRFLLEQFVLRTGPDMVILGYVLNDAEPELFYMDHKLNKIKRNPRGRFIKEGMPDAEPPKTILYKLKTAQLIWQLVNKARLSRQTESFYNSLYRENSPGWSVTRKSLKRIAEICRENGIECYVACMPLMYRLNENYPFRHIHQLLENEVASFGLDNVHFIDLFPCFKGQKDVDLWVHPTDQHPNEIAHGIIAETLFNEISGTVKEALN